MATFETRDAFLVALGAAIFESNQIAGVVVHLDTDPRPGNGMLAIWIQVPHDADDPDVRLDELRAVGAAFQRHGVGRVPDDGSQGDGIWDGATNNYEVYSVDDGGPEGNAIACEYLLWNQGGIFWPVKGRIL